MSNVKKNQRSETTEVKFMVELNKISDTIIKFLINDFGVKSLSSGLKLFTNNAKMTEEDSKTLNVLMDNYNFSIENNYQYWLVENFRDRILKCLDDVMTKVDYAYVMYPTTVYEYNIRRAFQNDAVCGLHYLKNLFQQICRIFPVNFKTYIPFISNIDDEIKLLKVWRKDGNKLYPKCVENDVLKTMKPTAENIKNIVALYYKLGNSMMVAEALNNITDMPWTLTYRINQFKQGDYVYDPKKDKDIMNCAFGNYKYGNYNPIYNENNQFIGYDKLVPGVMFVDNNGKISPIYGDEFNKRLSA